MSTHSSEQPLNPIYAERDQVVGELVGANMPEGQKLGMGDLRIQKTSSHRTSHEVWHVPTDGLLAGIVQRVPLPTFLEEALTVRQTKIEIEGGTTLVTPADTENVELDLITALAGLDSTRDKS